MIEKQVNTGDTLESCPFCGNKELKIWNTNYGVASIVECAGCTTLFVFPFYRKGVQLKEFWNKRAKYER